MELNSIEQDPINCSIDIAFVFNILFIINLILFIKEINNISRDHLISIVTIVILCLK